VSPLYDQPNAFHGDNLLPIFIDLLLMVVAFCFPGGD
jgi:hypothetical protein